MKFESLLNLHLQIIWSPINSLTIYLVSRLITNNELLYPPNANNYSSDEISKVLII